MAAHNSKHTLTGETMQEYRDRIMAVVCNGMMLGMTVTDVLKGLPDAPTAPSLYGWMDDNNVYRQNYARAREHRANDRADRIDRLCQQVASGEIDPNAARVAIDALKWLASKENSKSFGDKAQVEHTGANGGKLEISWLVAPAPEPKMLECEVVGEKTPLMPQRS